MFGMSVKWSLRDSFLCKGFASCLLFVGLVLGWAFRKVLNGIAYFITGTVNDVRRRKQVCADATEIPAKAVGKSYVVRGLYVFAVLFMMNQVLQFRASFAMPAAILLVIGLFAPLAWNCVLYVAAIVSRVDDAVSAGKDKALAATLDLRQTVRAGIQPVCSNERPANAETAAVCDLPPETAASV